MQQNKLPSLSVLMSVYNGAPFLNDALRSLLRQSFADFELVIIDDASTDETPAILAEYAERDARVRVFRNETNLKLPASLNKGLRLCRAPLVARADADDFYVADRLEKQYTFMAKHPEVGVASCHVDVVDEHGKKRGSLRFPTTHEEIQFNLRYWCCMSHPGAIYRRDVVLEAGGYDESHVRAGEDYDLWARLIKQTTFANMPEVLVHYRQHSTAETSTRSDAEHRLCWSIKERMLSEYLGRRVTYPEVVALCNVLQYVREYHAPSSLYDGLHVAYELMERAQEIDEPYLVNAHKRKLAKGLRAQALTQARIDRRMAVQLLMRAARLAPRQSMLTRSGLKEVARTVVHMFRARRPQPSLASVQEAITG